MGYEHSHLTFSTLIVRTEWSAIKPKTSDPQIHLGPFQTPIKPSTRDPPYPTQHKPGLSSVSVKVNFLITLDGGFHADSEG